MKPSKKAFAATMRNNPTKPEAMLWQRLRKQDGAPLLGSRFRRQALIFGYIVDFCCPSRKLIVEIDGKLHDPNADAKRDRDLARSGWRTLRIPARFVYHDLDRVVARIGEVLATRSRAWREPRRRTREEVE